MDHFFAISPQTISFTEAVHDMVRKIFGKPSDDPMKDLNVNVAFWWTFHEFYSRNSNSPRKLPRREFKKCKELFLEICRTNVKNSFWGQLFRETERLISGQTETTGISLVDSHIDKLVALSGLSICHCQGLRLFRFGAVCGKNGRQSYWTLEEPDSVIFTKQLLQRTESDWRKGHGVRMEDLPRTYYSGYPQRDSVNDGRITVWSSELHRQDHLHVNVQWHYMGEEGKWKSMWRKFNKSWRIRSKISSLSLAFSWTWFRKEVVRHLLWQIQWILGSNCKTSKELVTQSFDAPASLKGDNWKAKEEEGQQYSSQHVTKIFSWSSRWSFQSISSVFRSSSALD